MDKDLWCQGELKGDPEVAGIGVVSSVFTTALIAIIFSWVLWYLALWEGKNTRNSKLYRAVLKCEFVLADIQLATALAIICSSIILILSSGETSLYHVFIARCLAQANFTGHGASFIFDIHKQSNWSLRVNLYYSAIVLYLCWTIMCIEEWKISRLQTPRCFWNDSRLWGWYTTWLYIDIPWTIAGSLWIFAEATGNLSYFLHELDSIMVEYLKESWVHLRSIPKNAKQIIYRHDRHDRYRSSRIHSSRNTLYEWFRTGYLVLFYAFIGNVVSAIGKLIVGSLIAVTLSPPSTIPFTSIWFFAWHIYDTDTARRANHDILVAFPVNSESVSLHNNLNPEDDWGFGQLLPFFLLIIPFLQMADIFADESEPTRHTSLYYILRERLRQGIVELRQDPSPTPSPAEHAMEHYSTATESASFSALSPLF